MIKVTKHIVKQIDCFLENISCIMHNSENDETTIVLNNEEFPITENIDTLWEQILKLDTKHQFRRCNLTDEIDLIINIFEIEDIDEPQYKTRDYQSTIFFKNDLVLMSSDSVDELEDFFKPIQEESK